MVDSKSILASKGVWGGAIAVLASLAGLLGFNVAAGDAGAITGHIDSIIAAVGGILAIYGRISATKKLV